MLTSESTYHPDILQSFLIDHSHIRGKFVRLNESVDTILNQHDYPPVISQILSEMLVIVAMLSSNLKTEGVLTLQASGDGPVQFIVVDATHEGHLRGYAEIHADGRAQLAGLRDANLKDIFGEGRLAITLDQGNDGDRYQGIVELAGSNFVEAIKLYFTQSQQVEMDLKLATMRDNKGRWSAGGIMIERVPHEGGSAQAMKDPIEDSPEQWNRTALFVDTLTEEELLDTSLSGWNILMRLFNEDGVWAYQPKHLAAVCRCSRERVTGILSTIPQAELLEMVVDGKVSLHCQFCNSTQEYSEGEIQRLQSSIN